MKKLLKTVLLAGSLLASTAIVSFADAPKTEDKAPAAGSGSGSAAKSTGKSTTKTTKSTKPAGSGSGAKGSGSK